MRAACAPARPAGGFAGILTSAGLQERYPGADGVGMTRRFAACVAAALALVAPASAGASTVFTLTGHGWGHGIGMSQYGALGYAEHGWGYRQMMDHYFTGTHVAPLGGAPTERVLLSAGANVDFGASSGMTLRD